MESEFVLMDFDGVIVQSFPLSFAMHQILDPDLTEPAYRASFEDNAKHISSFLNHHPEQEQRFWQTYELKITNQPLAPHIADVVEQLAGIYTLIVVSSTNNATIKTYLGHHGLADHFTDIMGNDVNRSKTKKVQLVLQKYRARANECVMVTDTLGDIKEARAAGTQSIATTWGYHPETTLARGKPAAIIDDPDQLPGALEEYFDFSEEYD